MNQSEEFSQYVGAVRKEVELNPGPHPSEDELIAYHRGQLKEQQREKIQSHLVQCPECISSFREMSAFFESSPEGDQPLSEAELDRKWEAYRRRVQAEEPPAPTTSLRRGGFWQHRRATFALAASLLIIAVTSAWALWLRRENQWGTQEKSWAERLTELEEENRRLQDQTKTLESQLAELRQPAMNAPIYDLLPRAALPRAGSESNVYRIKTPATAKNFVLILHRAGNQGYSSYEIEIVDASGKQLWRESGLRPNSDGSFVLTLDRTFLSQGQYRLKLYGQSDNRSHVIADYVILIE
jgi:hypothetical protein